MRASGNELLQAPYNAAFQTNLDPMWMCAGFRENILDDAIKSGDLRHTLPLVSDLETDLQVPDESFEGRVNRDIGRPDHSTVIHLTNLS